MRAIVVDPAAKRFVRLGEAPEPVPTTDEVLVDVRHIALNYGDLNGTRNREAGFVPGWDAAGTVVQPAASGEGPREGSRVVTTMGTQGGWAARRAVHVSELAIVPDAIELAEASTLPVAGVTALRALRRSETLLGRRVLVTGASGGVGRFAVQLAALAGAHVIASVGSTSRGEGLRELGADEIVIGLDGVAPASLDVVLDNVGGPQLVAIWGSLAEGGVIQCIGTTSQQAAAFPSLVGMRRRIEAFTKGPRSGEDLEYLLKLMQLGRLQVDIGWRGSWSRIDEAAEALFGRQVAGKAVLDVD